jgi:hypothetical protein
MTISLRILEDVSTIQKNINEAIAQEINKRLLKNQSSIIADIKRIIPRWLIAQPEIQSLISQEAGSLKGQFGIPSNTAVIVNRIIFSVLETISYKYIKYDKNLNGGFELQIQPKDFNNLLSLREGHVIYDKADLHWLDWLLLKGDSIIVANYQYNPQTGIGRSKLGNMVKQGSFRVPPEFSGTKDNNFITRALVGSEQEKQVTEIFIKYLK